MNRTRIALLAGVSCLSCFPGLPVAYGALEVLRAGIHASLCERGFPDPAPGDPPMSLQEIDWHDGHRMPLGGAFGGENTLDLGSWVVHFPRAVSVTHDGSCGDECASAFEIDGLSCEDQSSSRRLQCSFHGWMPAEAEAERSCFLSLDGDLPPGSLERELPLEHCPESMAWLPGE